ncbi:SIR2 family NAD-dependent protein deacylase [Variovorax saccharolyticus]|uniref:SIR2 family NAD-dependent protein deacylase n=1 Tax=Variovorax saccharolyticus TaxID=3053516 RepID=UPI0025773488|nr:NAD-dependent deacylase [Variovorax sp. J31P216]MDM0029602.1 NAD-dependent deacylase [Variovorax sp. J31P216]
MISNHEQSFPSPPPSKLVQHVRAARRIAVLTGAGMSAESGVPTFRDARQGMWARFDPAKLATRQAFERDPAGVWSWHQGHRRDIMRATPNAGHLALREMAHLDWIEDLTVITQNIDDLHERARSPNVIHLHGSLFAAQCSSCGKPHPLPDCEATSKSLDVQEGPPKCNCCGQMVRPGVIWFGENLPEREWMDAMSCVEQADLMLVIGTSGRVQPAALLPEAARRLDCVVWVINPDREAMRPADRSWRAPAGHAMPALLRELRVPGCR